MLLSMRLLPILLLACFMGLVLGAPIETEAEVNIRRASFPPSPQGATLVQFKPSCSSKTVPMFVNNQYGRSSQTSAYIVQHGSGRNFQDYFSAVRNVIGDSGIIAAPNFYVNTDASAPSTWYQPGSNLAWASGSGTWSAGADAISTQCSTFDVYDSILNYFSNKNLFPNLKNVYFVSHSGGANLVSRYSQLYDGNHQFKFRYIVANAANQAYFTTARTRDNPCSEAMAYPYQLVSNGMPRYVRDKFSRTNVNAILQRWLSRDVVTLIGDQDTNARWPGGVQDCASQAQGGENRRDRNYAWWAYQNILAGTGADVSKYMGIKHLTSSGAKPVFKTKPAFNHQNCVIPGVGHDQAPMFSSECGRAAMTKTKIPAGFGASYP